MTQFTAITGGRILAPSGELLAATLLLEGDRVAAILRAGESFPTDTSEITVPGCVVAPGFIDTHTHGGRGRNFMEGTPGAFASISDHMLAGGVTACLVTTTSAARADLIKALQAADAARRNPAPGAVEVLGVHLEGPYVNPKFRGSHAEQQVRPVDLEELAALHEAAGGGLKVVTLAPDLPGAMAAIRFLAARGVQVSMGHTGATYQQAREALAAGVRRGTHLFNAMAPIHHREPGPITALFEDAGAYVELTVDGHHIHPAVVATTLKLVGPDRAILITDCTDVAGQGDGRFTRWEGTEVTVQNGQARTLAGSLAGSTLRMDRAVANLVNLVGVPLVTALRMASEVPARAIGEAHRKGSLAPGKDADLVVLNADLTVLMTIVRGQIAYDRRNQS